MKRRPITIDSPWTTFTPADSNREHFALLSYLPLKTYRAIPAFVRFSLRVQRQLRSTPGVVGYSLRAQLLPRNFWTLSAWTDEKSLMDFVLKIPHAQAMKAMLPHMGPTKFTKWKVSGSSLPLGWEEAIERSEKEKSS